MCRRHDDVGGPRSPSIDEGDATLKSQIATMSKFWITAAFSLGLTPSLANAQAPSTPTAIQTLINQNIPDGQTDGIRANQVRPTFNSLLPFTYLYYDTMTGLLKNFNGTTWTTFVVPLANGGSGVSTVGQNTFYAGPTSGSGARARIDPTGAMKEIQARSFKS